MQRSHAEMSYHHPQPPLPRHPGGRVVPRRDMKPQTVYQHRAPTGGPGLMPPPPAHFQKQLAPQHRVLLPNQNPQQTMAYFNPTAAAVRASGGASLYGMPQHHIYAPYPQAQVPQMVYQTQQPIALGQPMAQGYQQPVRVPNPPVMFNNEQPETNSQRQVKAPKNRSHAIKIVNPNTNAEVKVDDTPTHVPSTKVTAEVTAEFKSKVQSTIVENVSMPVAEVRPNAIITNPEEGEKGEEQVGDPGKPQGEVGVATGEGVGVVTGEEVGVVSETEKVVESQQHAMGGEGVRELTTPTVVDIACEEDIVRPSEETGQHEKDEVVKPHPPSSQDSSQVHVDTTSEEEKGSGIETLAFEGVAGEEQPPVSRDNYNKSADSGISTLESDSIPGRLEELDNTVKLEPEKPEVELESTNAEKTSVIESEQTSAEQTSAVQPEPASEVQVELSPERESDAIRQECDVVEPVSASLSNSVTQQVAVCPTEIVSGGPTETVSGGPTETVSGGPTETVSGGPTEAVSGGPTETVSGGPTETVSGGPTETVSGGPTEAVSGEPTEAVSGEPTEAVSGEPTEAVSGGPTEAVSGGPTKAVSGGPTETVSGGPTETAPTEAEAPASTDKLQGKSKTNKVVPVVQKGTDGRTMYSRADLMYFKDEPVCQAKPEGLDLSGMDLLYRGDHRAPSIGYGDKGGSGGGGGGGYDRKNNYNDDRKRRGGGGRGPEPKRIIHQPLVEKVELQKAEVRWTRPAVRTGADVTPEDLETEQLYRKFQGILNKLTPTKFQSLAEQALQLEISTEERLCGCIDKIFTKALEEPSFSIAYANLCKVMSPIKVENLLEDGRTKLTNFRRMLLTKCQHEFEKDKKDDETLEKMNEAIEQAETEERKQVLSKEVSVTMVQMRKRSLGNIRFIGELFKLKMLSESIMKECITRLLRSTSDEEALECFGKLIMTTGKDLDRPEAKKHMDAYFARIADIIKKGKIPVRIKFMLQDVQEMRDNGWVPRVRQDKQLKTIDQIHAEAKIEEAKEKEMTQQHQIINYRSGSGRGGDRRGPKPMGGGDEWQGGKGDRGGSKEVREKFDQTKVTGILARRKEKGAMVASLGPNTALRPGGWKKPSPSASTSAPVDKSAKPSRSNTTGSKRLGPEGRGSCGRGSLSGAKRAHTTPEQEREAALQKVSQFTSATPSAPASAVPVSKKPQLDTATMQRKIVSIIDELVNNADFKEAVECVKEMNSPDLMDIAVTEGINHTLEKSSEFRTVAGKLYGKLLQEKMISPKKFLSGLDDVLECAEEDAIDIPKIWDYLGELLAPVVTQSTLNLSLLESVPASLVESGRAAVLVAKVLQQSQRLLGTEEQVKTLWSQSRLEWSALGMREEDLGEFLSNQNLGYLNPGVGRESTEPYLPELQQRLGTSDATNQDITTWMKDKCKEDIGTPNFTQTLTRSVVHASVNGTGDNAIFNSECFEKRMELVKSCADMEQQGLEVLYGLQVAVTNLAHPPKLLDNMFNIVYNTEVLGEDDFKNWLDHGTELFGRGNAVMSVKSFFNWLQTDSEDAPNQT